MSETASYDGVAPSLINQFLVENGIRIANNPAVSPDMTLDFEEFMEAIREQDEALGGLAQGVSLEDVRHDLSFSSVLLWPKSAFPVGGSTCYLVESAVTGDCALLVTGTDPLPFGAVEVLECGIRVVPLYWGNLVAWKNWVQVQDPECTIFPRAAGTLERSSLGVGARFTVLHWPGVAWAMKNLGISLTANQNSIPRELVYDVGAMIDGRLSEVPFPFIGRAVPEGHQGQSVMGMSHAAVVAYLKYGFHRNRIPWGFNADHQPIGGRFDAIEDELVEGSLFASYITYDLSPELSESEMIADGSALAEAFERTVDKDLYDALLGRLADLGIAILEEEVKRLAVYVLPAMEKMVRRDDLYRRAREQAFTTAEGRRFFKELSIDELPGRTTPETLAVCLAMAEAMGVRFQFVAPNIGFQKNFPYGDNEDLRRKVGMLYAMAAKFGVSIGFHSGSGKSAENYRICGTVTEGNFEVKTSGRYTYEMGEALSKSPDDTDARLWHDWYSFTRQLALEGAFADNKVQRKFAREFIAHAFQQEGRDIQGLFDSPSHLEECLLSLPPSPDHMFWFEYNFLYVLAGDGSAGRLGDHGPAGYEQRKRFYSISELGRLLFARRVALYIIFLAETTGIVPFRKTEEVRQKLHGYLEYRDLLDDIA